MEPRPIGMSESLWEDLQTEAEREGFGTAEYVRRLLRQRDEPPSDFQSEMPDDDLLANLDGVEERIADIETGELASADSDLADVSTDVGDHTASGDAVDTTESDERDTVSLDPQIAQSQYQGSWLQTLVTTEVETLSEPSTPTPDSLQWEWVGDNEFDDVGVYDPTDEFGD